jgi:hypothetical protein
MLGSTDSYSEKDSLHSVPPTGAATATAPHPVPASSTSSRTSSSFSSSFPSSSDSKQPNHTNTSSNDRRNPSNKHIGRQLSCARLLYDCNWNSIDVNENRDEKNDISQLDSTNDHSTQRCGIPDYDILSTESLHSSSVDIAGKRKRSTADDTDTVISSDNIMSKKDDIVPNTVDHKLRSTKRVICSMASTLWGLGFVDRVEERKHCVVSAHQEKERARR